MTEGKGTRGGKREGAGRKSKAYEQKLIEKLTPMEKDALNALNKAVKKGESWAVKLFMEYMYGRPKEKIEHKHVMEQPLFPDVSANNGDK